MEFSVTNIAATLTEVAEARPFAPAIYYPDGRDPQGRRRYVHYTFQQLDEASDVIAAGLRASGIGRGTRAALMVTPSLEFFALTFGIFKAGAAPVMVDPGIGLSALKTCLGEAEPSAFIGVPKAHAARVVLGWARGTLKHLVTVGRKGPWGGITLREVQRRGRAADLAEVRAWTRETALDDVAAILFTSGSTGVPKGVVCTHRTFLGQVELIRGMYGIEPGEIDLPTFPLFALFDPALGMTSVIPEMDFTKPASVNPDEIFEAVENFGVTNMFGSPALLNTVSRAGEAQRVRLPTLRRVISAGAPVPATTMERMLSLLGEGARIHTPYGATECLPVATISSDEVLGETRAATDAGEGVCVGSPIDAMDVRLIAVTDEPIARWADVTEVALGETGEVCVKGPVVTERYFNRDASTALAKIQDGDAIWHRMGDLARMDEDGRLWFCGRKSQRVVLDDMTLFTVPCEAVFNTHPKVFRSALVGVTVGGVKRPALCVELEAAHRNDASAALREQLMALAKSRPHTAPIETFLFHPGFPVDIRHNAKIGRPALTAWAESQLS